MCDVAHAACIKMAAVLSGALGEALQAIGVSSRKKQLLECFFSFLVPTRNTSVLAQSKPEALSPECRTRQAAASSRKGSSCLQVGVQGQTVRGRQSRRGKEATGMLMRLAWRLQRQIFIQNWMFKKYFSKLFYLFFLSFRTGFVKAVKSGHFSHNRKPTGADAFTFSMGSFFAMDVRNGTTRLKLACHMSFAQQHLSAPDLRTVVIHLVSGELCSRLK